MALALRTVGKSWLDDVISVVAGLVGGYLLDKNPTIFMAKNIGIPVLSVFIRGIPDSLKYESEGMLGLLIYTLIGGGK